MPKVVRFHELGGPEVLHIEDQPARAPQPGEVRLRVQAVGLNRAEALYMRGLYFELPRLPSGLGYEAAGVVDAVGPDVDTAWIGKSVGTVPGFSMNHYPVLGEQAVVPVQTIAPSPEKFSPAESAAIWMQYMTAWGGLVHLAKVGGGDFVIIPAASSSVGLAAIQIVRAQGAISIAATRTSKKKLELLALGADHVIATMEEDLPARVREITNTAGSRVIFDPVGGPYVEKLAQAAAPGGIIIVYGGLALEPTPFPVMPAMAKQLTMRGYTLREVTGDPDLSRAGREYVFDRLTDGRFVVKIAKTFPFAESADAYRYLESNEQVGKVVITV